MPKRWSPTRAPARSPFLTRGLASALPSPGFERGRRLLAVVLLGLACLALGCASPEAGDGEAAVEVEEAGPKGVVHAADWPALESPVGLDPEIESRIDGLLGKMTLKEKVGQVIQAEIRHVTPDDLREYDLGSVLNGGGSHPKNDKNAAISDWVALADEFWNASTDQSDGGLGIPALWGTDAVHGHNNVIGATLFPHNIGLGATRDADLLRRIGEVTATEVLVTGLDWTFGPTVAVVRDDRWGRTYEGYSEDPAVVAMLGEAVVEGLQGKVGTEAFLGEGKMIATAKHFLGDGGTTGGKDQGNNEETEAELRRIHGAGYVTALEAGVQTVMASFSSWHGRKMHGHRELLTDVLVDQMGFDGFVVGDWNGHGQVAGCTNDDCPEALLAGVDMYMVPEDWKALHGNLMEQVESGEIPMERLEQAVRRILRVKIRAGLLEKEAPSKRPLSGKKELIGSAEHRAVAREAVRKSLVLLKNQGGLLPLSPQQTVLVAGDGADDIGKQAGGWTITWQGTGNVKSDFPGATSIYDGIRNAVESAGGKAVLDTEGRIGGARPDVAIVVFGEDPYAEFQGDRETVDYEGEGLELLQSLREAGIPVVSIFLSGRPLWVNPEINASDAFVAAWLPGSEGGGIADLLFRGADGEPAHDFTGKLSYSWPNDPSQTRVNVGDSDYTPQWPVGHGLSYGDDGDLAPLSEEIAQTDRGSSRTVYFEGGPVPPWKLYLHNERNGEIVAQGAIATTGDGPGHLEMQTVDRRVQEDARSAEWHGNGTARIFLKTDEPVDLDRESNGDLRLAFDITVDEAATEAVYLSMGCADENGGNGAGDDAGHAAACGATFDVSDMLPEAGSDWQTLSLRLRCFADAGVDMSRIDMPFAVETAGTLKLRFSDVRLASAADGDAPCPPPSPMGGAAERGAQ